MCLQATSTWRRYTSPNLWCLHHSYRWPHNTRSHIQHGFLCGIFIRKGLQMVWLTKLLHSSIQTVILPSKITSVLFLSQHPALTAGQRRYLCSIANVYSTERMRQQMKQHYLNVLHTCVQSGVYLNVSVVTFQHYHPSHVVLLSPRSESHLQKEVWR